MGLPELASMEHVSLDSVTADAFGSEDGIDSEQRRLSDPLGTTGVALNHYRIAPGDGFPSGLHAHADQEEVFVVLAGEATFETFEGEFTVEAGHAVRFAPGEFQSGRNDGEEVLVALAVGAPRDGEDVRIPADCPDCGHDQLRLETDDGLTFVCPDCGVERVPQDCPDCGSARLRITLAEEENETATRAKREPQTKVVCEDCGSEFESPPLE
ncbi:cupin domain-containing protein [Halorussus halophilus]|uniref:cupin domain-containing protein n=1 Tax=Halorussus halophilus TaxID=2650975 RepID=UPI001CE3E0BC|nr:cupin domain-containing protein [Halorussus halophilus]